MDDPEIIVVAPLSGDDWLPIEVRERAPISTRLLALLKATQLDRELVAGCAPEPGSALALHVIRLAGAPERRRLAAKLRCLIAEARCDGECSWLGVATDAAGVMTAVDLIDQVEMRLRGPRPVSARGVARLRLLLSDGDGPLYVYGSGDIRAEFRAVLALL